MLSFFFFFNKSQRIIHTVPLTAIRNKTTCLCVQATPAHVRMHGWALNDQYIKNVYVLNLNFRANKSLFSLGTFSYAWK